MTDTPSTKLGGSWDTPPRVIGYQRSRVPGARYCNQVRGGHVAPPPTPIGRSIDSPLQVVAAVLGQRTQGWVSQSRPTGGPDTFLSPGSTRRTQQTPPRIVPAPSQPEGPSHRPAAHGRYVVSLERTGGTGGEWVVMGGLSASSNPIRFSLEPWSRMIHTLTAAASSTYEHLAQQNQGETSHH